MQKSSQPPCPSARVPRAARVALRDGTHMVGAL